MLIQKLLLSTHAGYEYTLGDVDRFCVQLNRNGQVSSASAGDILLSRTLGNPLEGGLGRHMPKQIDRNSRCHVKAQ